MATHRFYISANHWNPENLVLGEEESHHCLDVMRCREGDRVAVFNGEGTEAEAQITAATKGAVELKALIVNQTPKPPASLTLGQAIPKGKNMDLIIQKATELGAARIVPLLSERTVVQLSSEDLAKKQQKWQRVVVEACKQCGQNWIPEVGLPCSVEKFTKDASDQFRLIAAISDTARTLKATLLEWNEEHNERPESATLLIGPEGDFTPAEISQALSAGFSPISLGPIILRSETAAIYALSVTAYELMDR
ncbi:MAG: 16S rRNA (uracil(1498)-N(3))-methyltransferase [Verrucomicrobiales bacterium]|jgi:16S rRNA (uracil1498-N3)-methyltransferase|nr:16S rRNA (uracil(1498)-N(3))-methyltransferase [Verrucomicrobiales bacterium]|tara:strand:- start:11088 stop:11840 length:753 start_codon:yes stop_codon:yes gene_type:complete